MDKTDQVKAEHTLRREGYEPGNGKAWTAGIGSALSILVLAAVGKYTGLVEIPGEGQVVEALGALGVSAAAGALVAWRTWAVPYLKTMFSAAAKVCLPLGFLLVLPACEITGQAVDWSTGALATAIDEACERGMTPLAIEGRKGLVAEINEKTSTGNHTPSDCDNDGLPDFAIDENGIPVPDVPTS